MSHYPNWLEIESQNHSSRSWVCWGKYWRSLPSPLSMDCSIVFAWWRPYMVHDSWTNTSLRRKRHFDWFIIRFCRDHRSDQHTDRQTHTHRQTTLLARIYIELFVMPAMVDCSLTDAPFSRLTSARLQRDKLLPVSPYVYCKTSFTFTAQFTTPPVQGRASSLILIACTAWLPDRQANGLTA